MNIIGTLQSIDENRGVVRAEDTFQTDIHDLWDACTRPDRLARWIADVAGDLRVGGQFRAHFTSDWEGTGLVEVCEPPRRLVVRTRGTDEPDDHIVEATLTPNGDTTTLTIEERGIATEYLAAYGAGWQIHAEDLAAHLAGRERCDVRSRWEELIPAYRQLAVQPAAAAGD